jgi:hypothetical protein
MVVFFISFPILKLHKIGKPKEIKLSSKHTDLEDYFKRTRNLVFIYIILAVIIPLVLIGYPNISYLDIIPYSVFSLFFIAFLIGASVVSWLFMNLVKSRYSYPMFANFRNWQNYLNSPNYL